MVVKKKKNVKKTMPRKTVKKTSKAQRFQLNLIALTNFNSCDGVKIAKLLKENREMWRSAFMPLKSYSLRDMEKNEWHADTLYIYAEDSFQHALEKLAREQFDADEISWVGGAEAIIMLGTPTVREKNHVILSVWWD